MNWLREMQCKAAFAASVLLLQACAPSAPQRPREGTLPEIDVLQMKENSDIALKLAQRNKADLDALQTRVAELERAVMEMGTAVQAMPIARMEELQNSLVQLKEEIELLKVRNDSLSKPQVFRTTPSHKDPEILPPTPDAYAKAMRSFDAKDYGTAANLFRGFTDSNPDSPYSDDAWYWIGESLFRRGDFADATTAFSRVLSYLHSDKSDDAQFMLGNCYLKLSDRKRAVAEFQKVETLYPQSEYIARARAEIKKNAGQ